MPSQENGHPVPIKVLVGTNIKTAREARDMTQADLGKAVGTDSTSVSRWERGRVVPNFKTLTAIGETLGHDLAWFYGDHTGDPEPKAAA